MTPSDDLDAKAHKKTLSPERKEELDRGMLLKDEEERIYVEYRRIHREQLRRRFIRPWPI